jgi:cytoskeleton protein RodZ
MDIGTRLRQAREARGLELREAAELLNLLPRYVAALEACDWKRMPAAAYTRGYLRKYATLLGLDAGEAIAAYRAQVGDDSDPFLLQASLRRRRPLHEFVQAHPGAVLGAGVGVAATAFAAVLWLVWPLATAQQAALQAISSGAGVGQPPQQLPVAGTQRVTVNVAPGGTYRLPAAIAPATQVPAIGAPAPGLLPPVMPVPAAVVPAGAPAEGGARGDEPAAAPAAPRPGDTGVDNIAFTVGDGGRELRFSFTDDCWIQVHDGTGARLVSDLRRRGESLIVRGEPPFSLTVGYAPAVSVEFDGEQVDLRPYTRDLVASLTVGGGDR